MAKYVIIDEETKEFYPDPIYTDKTKAEEKIEYLINYRIKHNMMSCQYGLEKLTKEREDQYKKEFKKFLDMID